MSGPPPPRDPTDEDAVEMAGGPPSEPGVPGPTDVQELTPGMSGVWLVRSRAATSHVWDLDAMTYRRQTGQGSTPMEHDNVTVPITRVLAWPAVGQRSMVFFDDPDNPSWEHWRICSRIRSITRLDADRAAVDGG